VGYWVEWHSCQETPLNPSSTVDSSTLDVSDLSSTVPQAAIETDKTLHPGYQYVLDDQCPLV